MPVNLSPLAGAAAQFFDGNGNPLAGGKLYTYSANTTSPLACYTNESGSIAHTNPIILDSTGRVPGGEVWLTDLVQYKFELYTYANVLIGSYDDISGINETVAASSVSFTGFKGQVGTVQDLADSDGSDWIGYLPASPGVARSAQDKMRDTVSVKDFGAVGDGSTDDTSAIQATINAVGAAGGGTVYFPAGTYKISSKLTVANNGVYLVGAGRRGTTLSPTAMSTDHILFDTVSNGGLSHLAIIPSGAQTGSTASVRVLNCNRVVLDSFLIFGNCQTGVVCDGGAIQFLTTISNFQIDSCAFSGIQVGNGANFAQDTTIFEGVVANCSVGILLTHCSGVYATSIDVLSCINNGIASFPATGHIVSACFFTAVLADTTTNGNGFAFFNNGGKISDINLVNCWGSSCFLDGLVCGTNCDGILISSSRFINNRRNGIYLQGGTNYTITGNQIGMNSMSGSGAYHGIAIASNISHFTIENNFSGGPLGKIGAISPNLQGYGILINSGASNLYNIIGNDLTGNVSGGISNGSSSTGRHIYGNLGYTTIESGSAFIAAGASSVTVTHGLSVTPTAPEISITANSAMGSNPFYLDTTSITSTVFIVRVAIAVAANSFFSWQARADGA